MSFPGFAKSATYKAEAIQVLLVALAMIEDRGEIPTRLKASLRNHYSLVTEELKEKCLKLIPAS